MKGRTAIITGSGRNIGKAIALKLAKNGVNIVINGSTNKKDCITVAEEAQSFGAQAIVGRYWPKGNFYGPSKYSNKKLWLCRYFNK